MGALASVSFAGTPAFMAPEMWAGKAANNSDQYSLAFTYAELRLGRRPLEGGDFVQVMTSALEGTPNLEGLSLAEQTVLRRALAKKPEDRYESCTDFVEALERAVSPDGRASRRRPTTQTPRLKPSETGASSTHQGRRATMPSARGGLGLGISIGADLGGDGGQDAVDEGSRVVRGVLTGQVHDL